MAKNDITIEELQKQLETAQEENATLKKALADAEASATKAQNEVASLKTELENATPVATTATVNSPNGLNLRNGPSKTSDVLTVLPHGSVVELLMIPGTVAVPAWTLIHVGDHTGWAMTEFLQIEE